MVDYRIKLPKIESEYIKKVKIGRTAFTTYFESTFFNYFTNDLYHVYKNYPIDWKRVFGESNIRSL